MQVRFINLTDGGSAPARLDAAGQPTVMVRVQVTGGSPLDVSLNVDGILGLDAAVHPLVVMNSGGKAPFTAELAWSPAMGGGAYTLTAVSIDTYKNEAQATIHVTVTGIARATPLPSPYLESQARAEVRRLIKQRYGVDIPNPSLQRFDFPDYPKRSRWIGAAYYKGIRYYLSIFDDRHVEWSRGEYADPAHRSNAQYFVLCRPSGTYRVLVVFVDYGNTGIAKADALADVPTTVSWLNGLYGSFATSHGFATAAMKIEAEAAYISTPPAPGQFLTAAKIKSSTGKDTANFDIVMQVDLDVHGTLANGKYAGLLEPGGGVALHGCDSETSEVGPISIWSSITAPSSLQGGLVMDFNHELSHLFGMLDDWPGWHPIAGPFGAEIEDWVTYDLFGWTDTDGDGVPEIVDSTPYGTKGPKP